ncbi:MAG: methylenetetrahydrofolate reductase [NAD(P)H] [Anaerolineae bacterium]|nr:methylenetetrahydrofolate reductase [NAD(P)H] [Anaerolineae bacterium]MBT3713518.1 methylenetetrahydrofolate reductase [NAD(P)H] [Anaerolineae bacterium]MBT4311309.1 methylenetetrahydrofolate reductase [NAD(P)H] [Anaerolineae bacterium]MBT4459681.1 methylenetetrahydrofolate reductase [NAD(P)H] [Anaerolineae bacterium]MBT4841549.1 methylenetetrahydrofolate reductase [NAD(P)H] [Anaerolineae bacterium]
MHIAKILEKPGLHFSFEFFPPKTKQASDELFQSIKELAPIGPAYVSVTYGAGGSTRDLTRDLIMRVQNETNFTVVAHLTTIGATRGELREILNQFSACGIENIMALRGDPPKGSPGFIQPKDGFRYAAELVSFIKKDFPHMGVGVAGFPEGHPETPNCLQEMDYLKAKVDAGADYICTQLFFKNSDFYDYRERCAFAGIKVPIIAGIMPIISRRGMRRIAELALGSRIPAKLQRAVSRAHDADAVAKVGIHWATQQVFGLFDRDVAGIHFYTLNQSKPTLKIYDALGIKSENKPK